MLSESEAQDLFNKYVELKTLSETDSSYERKLARHKNLMVSKFSYIIESKTYRYKKFSNYQDLYQDGCEALMMAVKTYSPQKGSIFWWMHKYIGTKIARCANAHSTMKTSIKKASNGEIPRRDDLPINITDTTTPYDLFNAEESKKIVRDKLEKLSTDDYKLITQFYKIEDHDLDMKKIKTQNKISKIIRKMRKNA
jgi:RNA polymerase sigma factor (sigma-70 family)